MVRPVPALALDFLRRWRWRLLRRRRKHGRGIRQGRKLRNLDFGFWQRDGLGLLRRRRLDLLWRLDRFGRRRLRFGFGHLWTGSYLLLRRFRRDGKRSQLDHHGCGRRPRSGFGTLPGCDRPTRRAMSTSYDQGSGAPTQHGRPKARLGWARKAHGLATEAPCPVSSRPTSAILR